MRVLADQTVLLTGGANGIGRAIAERLSRDGAAIFLVDVDEDESRRLEADLRLKGSPAWALTADVANESEVQRVVERALSIRGGIDILVNNAGIMDGMQPVHKMELALWE